MLFFRGSLVWAEIHLEISSSEDNLNRPVYIYMIKGRIYILSSIHVPGMIYV